MSLRVLVKMTLVAAAALLAAPSLAQENPSAAESPTTVPPCDTPTAPGMPPPCYVPPPAPAPTVAPPPPVAQQHRRHNIVFAPSEVSLTTGAGVSNYFGSGVTGALDPGAAWDARVTVGTRSIIAVEAGYVGSTNSFDMPGERSGHIVSNGLDGDLRLQVPTRVEPYIFGGVGYNHMSTFNRATIGSTGDDQLTVPAGAGLTGYIGRHATVDLRGTYRFTPDNSTLFVAPTSDLHQWVAQARVGYMF
jgi:hypothetical protein